jgi:hypothetical protein
MKFNYTIENVVIFNKCTFFYLHNFPTLNTTVLYGSIGENEMLSRGNTYIGLWKIKKIK